MEVRYSTYLGLITETLKLTPLRISNIPPPMAADELTFESPVVHVSFDPTAKTFAVLHHRSVSIASYTTINSIRIANLKIVHSFRYYLTLNIVNLVSTISLSMANL